MHLKYFGWIIAGVVIFTNNAEAQTTKSDPVDWQTRLGTSVDWKLNKKWELELGYQLRLTNNLSTYSGSYISLGGAYNISKKISALAYYRLALTTDGTANRLSSGFEFKQKIGAAKLTLRPLVQYSRKIIADDESSSNSKWLVRTKAELAYPIGKKISVYDAVEPFFTFDPDEYFLDNIRNKIGVKYNYLKNKKVDVYYMYRPDFSKSYNRTFHVVGVNFDFSLKSKK